MSTLRYVTMAAILCCMALTAFCQDTGWKSVTLLTERRYSQIADPALERDEMAILNSITYKL